jgi:hypothetical protein
MERRGTGRLAAVAIGVAAVSIGAGSAASGEAKKSVTPQVTVTACVDGGVLSGMSAAAQTQRRDFASRYRLSGPKALVKEIKRDHDGHVDEFTGTISGDLDATGTGPTVDLGKLSVRMGGVGPNDQPNAARVPETPVFQVASFKHTDAKCR